VSNGIAGNADLRMLRGQRPEEDIDDCSRTQGVCACQERGASSQSGRRRGRPRGDDNYRWSWPNDNYRRSSDNDSFR
jgi:hypothetical protein